MPYSEKTVNDARALWLEGVPIADITKKLNINSERVVYQWRDKFEWAALKLPEAPLLATSRAYNRLLEQLESADIEQVHIITKKMDRLADIMLKLEKVESVRRGDSPVQGQSQKQEKGERKPKKKRNQIDDIGEDAFSQFEADILYPHQRIWIKAGEDENTKRQRFILKSRQIGATFTFAYEAFKTATTKGHHQIFISSTRAQAEVFKSFISVIAKRHFDVELSGNPIKLSNGAELHFLSPNSFADSRSGDVYFDEVFKTYKFQKMEEIAAPMATLKDFKKTYFSSPTAISHEAYLIWSGERYTRFNKDVKIKVDNLDAMKLGRLDDDGIWRCACTIHHAIEMGWDKVDLEQLRQETPDPRLFAVVYECEFIDDSQSVFDLNDLLACAVDSREWLDFDIEDDRPYGSNPVTIGYDPAGTGDNASAVVLSKPAGIEEKFRMLEKLVWRHKKAPDQCNEIENLTEIYSVEHLEIDSTGPGYFVGDFVEKIYPDVIRIKYDIEYKTAMVQKAQAVIRAHRFEYDENDTDLPLAFLTVKQTTTKHNRITYASDHKNHKQVGHGDEAWATMHAFMCEDMNPQHMTHSTYTVYDNE